LLKLVATARGEWNDDAIYGLLCDTIQFADGLGLLHLRPTEQKEKSAFGSSLLRGLWDYLVIRDSPVGSDLIFVLAGRPERKVYGLELHHRGFARRLILSVGRFEVRQTALLGFQDLHLRELASRTPPAKRHFFIDLTRESQRVAVADLHHTGTYGELESLGCQLQSEKPSSLILVSTSIHLRRARWCCQKIQTLRHWNIRYVPVPEGMSSVRRDHWWRRLDHWSYVKAEWTKLIAYTLFYG
jgi:hypothetical protein